MGLDASSPLIGSDLLHSSAPPQGRAIMQFDQLQAYREGDHMVLLQPGAEPKTLSQNNKKWQISPARPGLIDKAIAHALYAKWAYAKGWHGQ